MYEWTTYRFKNKIVLNVFKPLGNDIKIITQNSTMFREYISKNSNWDF